MENDIAQGMASIAVCLMGGMSMIATKEHIEPTGIGWAIIGLIIIWSV